jgi:hypothetical protein
VTFWTTRSTWGGATKRGQEYDFIGIDCARSMTMSWARPRSWSARCSPPSRSRACRWSTSESSSWVRVPAGCGIAGLLRAAMIETGLAESAARSAIYMVNAAGPAQALFAALAVGQQACREGVAEPAGVDHLEAAIHRRMWAPQYRPMSAIAGRRRLNLQPLLSTAQQRL